MGGTVALLGACEFEVVDAAISWAAPAACKTPWERWSAEQRRQWQQTGVQYYLNGRTRQKMPLYYQLYEDWEHNASRFDLQTRLATCKKPLLVIHGREDVSVQPAAASLLATWAPAAQLSIVDGDHTFNRKHPASGSGTTTAMAAVMKASIDFVQSLVHN
jgi:pimeloyl-ACP methyl ester carboxylesterase